ncbi:PhzF family phenazine biosynthesis protein [Cognatishimia sp. F0-27]|uniref:PhzF family phenazine biosynthesis protein n=1 Tax=Cognatishimia sp. F0-27 TaxID=2816855 RepID=UPI001D0C8121|nr:PhzF family phenazine biosynthesis protein [Cognatishimia sp. F0-27]
MPDKPFATLDVFTEQRFAGNPLAVVEDAGDLSADQMQIIAREFNLSETIFVMPPRNPAHSARVRIFFPTAEIPFAGHPTIGCAIHLALAATPGQADFDQVITLEEEAGDVPVTVTRRDGRITAEFRAPVLPVSVTGAMPPDRGLAADALDLSDSDFSADAPHVFEGGPAFLYLPLASLDALARARPLEPAWGQMLAGAQVDSAWLYATRSDGTVQARMFSPNAGIPEDPATGSAAAIFAAQYAKTVGWPDGESRLTIHQGHEMGRPSRIGLRVDVTHNEIEAIFVSGSAVPVSHGRVMVPAG